MIDLTAWFGQRHEWLQDAARRLIQNGHITPTDLDELVLLCKREVPGAAAAPGGLAAQPIPMGSFGSGTPKAALRLVAMAEIAGINALAPRNPLTFGPEPLTIVFGSNGSGKSGYMRLLKHICGAKTKGTLLGNVFEATPADKQCTIRYTVDGNPEEVEWTPSAGIVKNLRGVAIYDTECAHVYIGAEHEVTYEPPILAVLRQLVEICGEVKKRIDREIASKVSAKPTISSDHASTASGIWYGGLIRDTTQADIDSRSAWTAEHEAELRALVQRLSEPDPAVKAKTFRKEKGNLAALLALIRSIESHLTDEAFTALRTATTDAASKRKAASDDAKKVFAGAPLEGVASKSWRLLWEQAREYSEKMAYPVTDFPNVEGDARCVLCQQLLESEARERLRTFEEFVKGNLERWAAEAEARLEGLLKAQLAIPAAIELTFRTSSARFPFYYRRGGLFLTE